MWQRNLPRLGVWVFVSLATVGGLFASYPGGATNLLRDLRDYSDNARRVEDGTVVKRQLDLSRSAVRERIALKEQLCEQLLRGEVGLSAAAGAYLGLLESYPALLDSFRRDNPGDTDEQRAAANLLRQTFDSPTLTADEQRALLANFRSRYGAEYPFVPPTPSADPSRFEIEP